MQENNVAGEYYRVKVRKAVFPVAGMGTRFLPATKATPKEMLPIVDKPLIHYVVEEAAASGIEQIIFVTGRGKTALEDYFDRAIELEALLESKGDHKRLELVRSISSMCEVFSVRQARDLVGDEPFVVILPDDVIRAKAPATAQLITQSEKLDAPVIAVMEVTPEVVSSYGVIDGEKVGDRLYAINGLVEKPPADKAPSNLAIIGRYVLTPDIFSELSATGPDKKGEIQLTAALDRLRAKRPVYGYHFEGERYDAGDKVGFLTATVDFALAHPEIGDRFRTYLKGLSL
jgi:UTP--glucose-1-phosphate uridylyltransferase